MSKYKAVKTRVDGITFDSKKEAARYCELRLAEKAGVIWKLKLQPKFPIIVNEINCGFYRADFEYITHTDTERYATIIEDCKGVRTPVYRLKKKLIEALYTIKIKET